MTLTYEVPIGEHLVRCIEKMLDLANDAGAPVQADFNGIPLHVDPGATAVEVEQRWDAESRARGERYRNSPEGRAAAAKRAAEVAQRQRDADGLTVEMHKTLNPEDVPAVLRWLMRYEETAGDVDVKKDRLEVLDWFLSHGFEVGVNVGPAFDANDRENVARYIIGQALDGIQSMGCPHPVVSKFANEWLIGLPISLWHSTTFLSVASRVPPRSR